MAISRRTLSSGQVSWRVKIFSEQRVIAQKSFHRLSDAKRWQADQTSKLRAGDWIDPARGRMSFARLAEEWQSSREHLAARSQETTRYLLDRDILPVLGRLPLAAISATDIELALTEMTTRGLATSTRRRALSVMRLVLDRALQDRRLATNVAKQVPLPHGNTRREPHWLSAPELGRLADTVPVQCRPVVLFLGLSGCRFSEMAALTVGDVIETPHGLGLRVHRAAPQSKRTSRAVLGSTKTHRSRTVPVPAAVAEYVRCRTAGAASSDYLFPTPSGLIWTNTNFRLRSKWTSSTRSAGLAGTTIHDLRHTAASLLIAAGADVKAVQVILGHASATMTMDLYGHLFSDAPWRAMERLPEFTDHSLTISAEATDPTDHPDEASAS
ncbi:tyrosine-type recombinase/integrase [Pengzhenrongella sp.]|jgi:integrase|uniref:tyrosine-type recombinase/integrase n=1 Tax=Pengzhenrongella sp. TaxID=2888820 RepID=UPI002F952398